MTMLGSRRSRRSQEQEQAPYTEPCTYLDMIIWAREQIAADPTLTPSQANLLLKIAGHAWRNLDADLGALLAAAYRDRPGYYACWSPDVIVTPDRPRR